MVRIREQNNNTTISVRSGNTSGTVTARDNTDILAVGAAKDWAIKMDGTVNGSEYSSKYYATQAAASSTSAGSYKDNCQTIFNNTKAQAELAKSYAEQAEEAASTNLVTATEARLGGIMVGNNLSITAEGTLSADVSISDLNAKQDVLTAGTGISIQNNTISCSQTSASVSWGNISGTLSNQTDLQNELASKADSSALSGYVTTQQIATTSSTGIVKPDGTSIFVDSNGVISADYADKNFSNTSSTAKSSVSNWIMPSSSSNATALTVGVTGTTYTMTKSGWLRARGASSGSNQRVALYSNSGVAISVPCPWNGSSNELFLPVKADDVVTLSYTANVSVDLLNFIPSVGEV